MSRVIILSAVIDAIKRACSNPDDVVLDHVPVQRSRPKRDWRERALVKASERYGKPFKCAGAAFNREVMHAPDSFVAVQGNRQPIKPETAVITVIKPRKSSEGV